MLKPLGIKFADLELCLSFYVSFELCLRIMLVFSIKRAAMRLKNYHSEG
jgi:hypothetical protein